MKTFLWGAATSSHQIEGGNSHNDWWVWEAEGKVDGGVRSDKATDHLHRFREDLAMARRMGLNTYRFSFEWSRLEPRKGEWSEEGFAFYEALLSACEEFDLIPMATLHHFTLPKWLSDIGGFANPKSPELFAGFTKKIAERFGSRIPLWCTINEPIVLVCGSYIGQFMPPAKFDMKSAAKACFNLLKAHVLAYDILKSVKDRQGKFSAVPQLVGFAHNMISFKPERRSHPIEKLLSWLADRFYNEAWLRGVSGKRQIFSIPFLLKSPPQVEIALGRRTFDFIGINYYTKAYLQWRPRTQTKEQAPGIPIGMSFARRKEVASDLGWAVYPKGLGKLLRRVSELGAPIIITENGIADSADRLRPGYLRDHLLEVAKAIESGIDVLGYYHWSLIDNFEWIKGFWPRFGLAEVDYDSFERIPRGSAELYQSIIGAHENRKPDVDTLHRFQILS